MGLKDWLGDNQLSSDIFNKKYRNENETVEEFFDRIAHGYQPVIDLIRQRKFIFGGRILANRGLSGRKLSLSNCYVITPPEDNIESIFTTAAKLARTYSYGGGCGVDVSKLAPKGAVIHNAAKTTSGATSFMDFFSYVTGMIGQAGRRGALMLSISCNHPDLEGFINLKTETDTCTKANISVRVSDEFMQAVIDDKDWTMDFCREEYGQHITKTKKARDIFRLLALRNWEWAEPGILYWDRIQKYNLLDHTDFQYAGVNPCVSGDTLILTKQGYKRIDSLIGTDIDIWNGKEWSNVVPKVTGHNQPMLKIKFSNGCELRCTKYHKFILKSGERTEAQQLQVGDKLQDFFLPHQIEHIRITVTSIEEDGVEDTVYCVNEPKNHSVVFNGIMTGNCAEEPLPAGGSCLLGSINLAEFVKQPFTKSAHIDFDALDSAVHTAVVALNQVLIEGLGLHPLIEQQQSVTDWRQIGLGTMGLGDMLIKLGIKYGSPESISIIETVYRTIAVEAIRQSLELAKAHGCYPKCNKQQLVQSNFIQNLKLDEVMLNDIRQYGLYNSQLLTCAPTGSIGTMLNISTGVEPYFALQYTRRTQSLDSKDTFYQVNAKIVDDYIKATGNTDLPECFVTAADIAPIDRIKVQAALQKYIDASISSTINLPKKATVDDVYNIYIEAWKHGLKGITVYRSGCKREGILTTDTPAPAIIPNTKAPKRPKELEADFYTVKSKGEQYIVLVGLLDGKPYEVFAFQPNVRLSVSNHKGIITKKSKMHYSFKSDNLQIPELELANDNVEEKAATLYTSMLLRHGVDIRYIIKTAKKVNDNITSFSAAMCRVLSKYIPAETTGTKCPDCGGEVIREGGCEHCKDCGWSKCN